MTLHVAGISLRFSPTPLCAEIWIDPTYHRDETDFVERYLRAGDTFVDVGANIGLVALAAARLTGPTGRVFAIEAHPRIFGYLEGNIALNGFKHVTCFNVAAGNSTGSVEFTDHTWDEINSVVTTPASSHALRVPLQTLDAIVTGIGSVTLLKIDVEGFEKFVLEGAEGILARTTCLYFESNREHYAKYGYTSDELFRLLRQKGFTLLRTTGSGQLASVPDRYESTRTENIIATRDIGQLTTRTGWTVGHDPQQAPSGANA